MAIRWSVVVPYYNEVHFLPKTVASLVGQTLRPLQLIFVDNGSTDGSTACVMAQMAAHQDVDVLYLNEPRPGKINALETGLAHVTTDFVATCDADTEYPPHYLSLCQSEFTRLGGGTVAMMALGLSGSPHSARAHLKRWLYPSVIAPLLSKQCHTGGYGQTFRTAALHAVGGYGSHIWHHVLEDHEVINRILRHGKSHYHKNLWCITSDRRTASISTRWSLFERLLYHATPFAMKDWFFYSFLKKRFTHRHMDGINLRLERAWE